MLQEETSKNFFHSDYNFLLVNWLFRTPIQLRKLGSRGDHWPPLFLLHCIVKFSKQKLALCSTLRVLSLDITINLCCSSNPPCLQRSKFIVYLPHTLCRGSLKRRLGLTSSLIRGLLIQFIANRRDNRTEGPLQRDDPSPAQGAVLVLSGGQEGGETSRGLHQRSCEIECVVLANTAHTKYNVAHK